MIHNFTYNSIDVTVDTDKDQVSFADPSLTNVDIVYQVGNFDRQKVQKQIVIQNTTWKEDNGVIINETVHTVPKIVYNNSEGMYDFFDNLQTGTETVGHIFDLSLVNAQLAHLQQFFIDEIRCFDYNNDWAFYHPIQPSVTHTDETAEGANDGTITLSVANSVVGNTYEYSIDNGTTWQATGDFTGLTPAEYVCVIRCTTENNVLSATRNVTIQAFNVI